MDNLILNSDQVLSLKHTKLDAKLGVQEVKNKFDLGFEDSHSYTYHFSIKYLLDPKKICFGK